MRPSTAAMKALGRKTRSMKRARGKNEKCFNSIGRPFFPRAPPSDNTVHRFHQMINLGTITSSVAVTVAASFSFSEAQLDLHSSYEAIFDQYRIPRIEFFTQPVAPTVASATANSGFFFTVVDYDDSVGLSSIAGALDYENVIESVGFDGHYRDFVPHVAVAAYSGAFSSFANETSPWIDCASNAVLHYGVKCFWTTTDAAYLTATFARLYVEYRNVR
jgi:hypothetical protein